MKPSFSLKWLTIVLLMIVGATCSVLFPRSTMAACAVVSLSLFVPRLRSPFRCGFAIGALLSLAWFVAFPPTTIIFSNPGNYPASPEWQAFQDEYHTGREAAMRQHSDRTVAFGLIGGVAGMTTAPYLRPSLTRLMATTAYRRSALALQFGAAILVGLWCVFQLLIGVPEGMLGLGYTVIALIAVGCVVAARRKGRTPKEVDVEGPAR